MRVSDPDASGAAPRDKAAPARSAAATFRSIGGSILETIREDPALPSRFLRNVAWRTLSPEQQAIVGDKDALPEHLLAPLVAQSFTTLFGSENEIESMYVASLLAAAEPEDLYLPAEHKGLAFPKFYPVVEHGFLRGDLVCRAPRCFVRTLPRRARLAVHHHAIAHGVVASRRATTAGESIPAR
jgi:hypothetical protein